MCLKEIGLHVQVMLTILGRIGISAQSVHRDFYDYSFHFSLTSVYI